MLEAFAQTVCGVGTKSVTKDGVMTCVLDGKPEPTGSYSGLYPTLDFSSPDAIQQSMFQSLLPNLMDSAQTNLGNVFGASPILLDILTLLTSLAGIIPISAGVIVGMALLFKKMRYNQKANAQKIIQDKPKKKFSFPKLNLKKKKKTTEYETGKESYEDYLKKMEAEQTANDFHDSLAEEGLTPQEIQQEIDSKERELEVITDPKEATETMQEIEEMVEDKKSVEPTGGFILPDSLDPVREEVKDPDNMSLEELEKQIKESGHDVKVKDDEIEITEKPKVTVVEKPTEEQIVHSVINESSEIMENELDSILPEDFDPTPEKIQQAQEHFDQPDPTEEEIAEVQRLCKEGMSQDEAINAVVKNAREKQTVTVEEELTEEQSVIKDMKNERDIFKLDIPAKKKSRLLQSLEKSPLGKKMMAKKKAKEKELDIKTVKQSVLTDLGHQRMKEYADKIEKKMLKWADNNNLNEKARSDLKDFSLFASMCEMIADKKTSKKRYWQKIIKYDIS